MEAFVTSGNHAVKWLYVGVLSVILRIVRLAGYSILECIFGSEIMPYKNGNGNIVEKDVLMQIDDKLFKKHLTLTTITRF